MFQIALKNQPFKTNFIDAMAGDGTWKQPGNISLILDEDEQKSAEDIKDGSAIISLKIDPPFDSYFFNEIDRTRAADLKERAQKILPQNSTLSVSSIDANKFIEEKLEIVSRRDNRSIILLDPFGMQISWNTVEIIASIPGIDMWYLFPTEAIIRNLPHKGIPTPEWGNRLDRVLGDDDWRTEFYKKEDTTDLFGNISEDMKREASFSSVERYVVNRLKVAFAGRTVLDEPLRLGSRGRAKFSFCFAASNSSGPARALTRKLAGVVARSNKRAVNYQ